MMQQLFDPAAYPYLQMFTTEHVMRRDYDFAAEFEFGLTAILEALETSTRSERRPRQRSLKARPRSAERGAS